MKEQSRLKNLEPELSDAEIEPAVTTLYENISTYGLLLFEPDGDADGVGLEVFDLLLGYFERTESYIRCARIRDFIIEYKKRWPDYKMPEE
ncbi:MAG: hypothetical protein IPP77_10890 [Bacteroidetes bacterium]|nr:hypothetical protein [Bacteroidota bacterium]